MTLPGWDTNPSQVSSQQSLVLIYLPRKDGKLSWLRRKRRSHKYSNLGKAGDQTGNYVVWRERSYQLRQPRPPKGVIKKKQVLLVICVREFKAAVSRFGVLDSNLLILISYWVNHNSTNSSWSELVTGRLTDSAAYLPCLRMKRCQKRGISMACASCSHFQWSLAAAQTVFIEWRNG